MMTEGSPCSPIDHSVKDFSPTDEPPPLAGEGDMAQLADRIKEADEDVLSMTKLEIATNVMTFTVVSSYQ